MTTSGPRYHIPFPTAFLSLNTKPSKTANAIASPESDTTHSFLSNRSVVSRHSSVSSQSSTSSFASAPSTPPTQAVELKTAVPAFLPLNSKYTAPPTKYTASPTKYTASPTKSSVGGKTSYLSNNA